MIDNNVLPLYYLSSLAGLVMVIGGIWLLNNRKIYIDSQSKQVTEIEIPMMGKFNQRPRALHFCFGFHTIDLPPLSIDRHGKRGEDPWKREGECPPDPCLRGGEVGLGDTRRTV
jgi:hypothetical protein